MNSSAETEVVDTWFHTHTYDLAFYQLRPCEWRLADSRSGNSNKRRTDTVSVVRAAMPQTGAELVAITQLSGQSAW